MGFAKQVRAVAAEELEAAVDSIAARYARRGSAGHAVIAAMLRNVADRPTWTLMNALADTFGARGFFGDPPLAPGDPRYSLQRRTTDIYQRGAQLVARRGAGRCLCCGAREGPGRPFRADGYCASHTLEYGQEKRDYDVIRTVLRGAAEALGIKAAGKRARRVR